jgi:hypothetical protein
VRDRLELVKAPAKEIPDTNGQRKVNQSQHCQVLPDLLPAPAFARGFGVAGVGANRKRSFFFVKYVRIIPDS